MPKSKIKPAAADALVGLWTIGLIAFVIAALYFTRELLIPLALAALFTFLLSPLVGRVERWIGRIAAVLLVVVLIFAALGGAGWMVTHQLIDLATKLPQYKGNISQKLHAFQAPRNGALTKINETVDELKKELPGQSPAGPTVTQEVGKPETAVSSPPSPPTPAVPVKVIETSKANPFELIQTLITPLLGPLGTAALVLLLVIFMLFEREDLRNRLIRLIGQGRISATTHAMEDAADRVSRYLRMQLFVNVCYGTCIGIGLYFIGVPNALLWGALGTVLRFIPYVGVWIATLLPTLLAIAISPHWMMPVLAFAVCGGVEVMVSNAVEPLLYGKHTGVSSIALIMAAVFWTWLWGPLGLIMATPLTVCLVVIGRHVPRLSFLSVLLSDEEPLTPAEECYHRLLTAGEQDETELVETYLKTNSLMALYDSVLIPAITAAETDARQESLDQEQLAEVKRNLRDMLDYLASRPHVASDIEADKTEQTEAPVPAPGCRVCCVPARGERDELAGSMLVQLLRQQHFEAQNAPAKMDAGELVAFVEKADPEMVVVAVVAPSTVIHARYLSVKLRARLPRLKIIVGLWGTTEKVSQAASRLRDSGADQVAASLADAMAQIAKFAPPITEAMTPAPIPEDEEQRLAALEDLQLLDTESEVVFDRITARLARIFEVPIALLTLVGRDRQFFKSATGLPEDLAKARQTARDVSVCGHVVASNEVLVIEDLLRDRRFANNPLLKERGLRFYAGVPVRAANGQPIGSLCILDTRPRQLTWREKRLLQEYANEVMEEFGRRSAVVETASAA
jgi:predicted PurR-regulated permease PerM